MSDLSNYIATYELVPWFYFYSGMIIDDRFYLGGYNVSVFEVNASITRPLTPLAVIYTRSRVSKILRVGNELLLG